MPGQPHARNVRRRDLRLCQGDLTILRDPCSRHLLGVTRQVSGRKSRSPTVTGTSREARVTETSDWRLYVLPSAEANCGATPTECCPFFGSAVSSMTRKPARSPTRRSAYFQKGRLERSVVPHPCRDEMIKLIVADLISARGHRLNALAVTWPDQTGNVERTHPTPRRMRKPRQKGLKPPLQIVSPLYPEDIAATRASRSWNANP